MTQKQRSLTLLGGVVALAAGLGLYRWYGIYQAGVAKQKAQDVQDTLFTFKKEQVKKLAVTSNGQTVEGTLQDAEWTIDRPIKTAGDKFAFDSIADKLAGLKQKRDIGNQSDLTQYGLSLPRTKVVATLDDGKPAELDLGSDNSYDGTLYAKRGDDSRVSILEAGVRTTFDKGLFDLRDKRILVFADGDVRHIDVGMPEVAYGLDRVSNENWMVTAPTAMVADSQRCTQIMNSLEHLKATRFAADDATQADLARFGLDKPTGTVQVILDKNVQRTLTFSAQKEGSTDHIYVKVADQPFIAEVSPSSLKDLAATLADLRDKTILTFDQDQVSGIRFQVGTQSFEVRRQSPSDAGAETWSLAASPDGGWTPAKKWKLTSLSSSLHDLKGSSLVTEKADAQALLTAGLTSPAKVITVLGKGDQVLAKLLVGKTENNKVNVEREGSPKIFQVDAFKLNNVPSNPADLADAPVPDGGSGQSPGAHK